MVKQHTEGYFINGRYFRGDYERYLASEKLFGENGTLKRWYILVGDSPPYN